MLLDRYQNKVYQSGLKFILYVAVRNLYRCDVTFDHSLDKGIYCMITSKKQLTNDHIQNLRQEMNKIIQSDHKIIRKVVTKKDAYDFYLKVHTPEKANNIRNSNTKTFTLYELNGFYNYFMSEMPESTGQINKFNLTYIGNNGLVLNYPLDSSMKIPNYQPQNMILNSFKEYNNWMNTLKIDYVSDLNKIVSDSKIKEFIKKNDVIMDNQLYTLAQTIKSEKRKVVLLGGPSSSGKTTSTKKLALYLSSIGLHPLYLGLDDYFKDRNESPKDANGENDFESLNAIDLELFNTQLKSMLAGQKVHIPKYNFIAGKKEYKGHFIELKENDIILIEGLHCLNEELTKDVPKVEKLKIYASPFTPLNIDRHNHFSTTDLRLIRRIVRDNRTRGYNVEDTLNLWEKVRAGETQYVFPFTNEANIILNTAFIYEMGVLRVYAEPLLYSVDINSKYYNDARRLINELQMFFPIPSEYISDDNVLREFIGNSYFEER